MVLQYTFNKSTKCIKEEQMKVDVQQAHKLREEGCTYKEIAQTIGCSEDWCKRNLKFVVKNQKDEEILAQTIKRAKSVDGITNIEIRRIIRTLHTNSFCKEDRQREDKIFNRIKVKLRKIDGCLVRPYWLQPQQAQQSFDALMQSTRLISDRVEEEVASFIELFDLDESYTNSIRWAIVSLTHAGSKLGSGTDIQSTINNLENLVTNLRDRNTPLHFYNNTYVKKCALKKEDGEKVYCGESVVPELLPIEAYCDEFRLDSAVNIC